MGAMPASFLVTAPAPRIALSANVSERLIELM